MQNKNTKSNDAEGKQYTVQPTKHKLEVSINFQSLLQKLRSVNSFKSSFQLNNECAPQEHQEVRIVFHALMS